VTIFDPYALPEDDERQWELLSSGSRLIPEGRKTVPEEDRVGVRLKVRRLVLANAHMRGVLRRYVSYVLGRGPQPKFPQGPKELRDALALAWKRFVRTANWRRRKREILVRLLRDGEVFIRRFSVERAVAPDGGPETATEARAARTIPWKVLAPRFIDPELIKDPQTGSEEGGIVTEEGDVETIQSFKKVKASNPKELDEEIPATDVLFHACESDLCERRGVSPFASIVPYVDLYGSWLRDRIVLSKVRSAVALVRTFDKKEQQVKAFLQKEQDEADDQRAKWGETKPHPNVEVRQKKFRPGTVINAGRGVDYKFISPNLQAADVHHDGRAILLAVAAGAGLAEFMVSGDGSNANYASTMVTEGVPVKEVEDWREVTSDVLTPLWVWVVEVDRENPGSKIPASYDPWEVEWEYPPIVSRDREKEVRSNVAMVAAGAMSRRTAMERDGLDPDTELERIEAEEVEDLGREDEEDGGEGGEGDRRPRPRGPTRGDDEGDDEEARESFLEDEDRRPTRIREEDDELAGRVAALEADARVRAAAPPAPAPKIEAHVHVPKQDPPVANVKVEAPVKIEKGAIEVDARTTIAEGAVKATTTVEAPAPVPAPPPLPPLPAPSVQVVFEKGAIQNDVNVPEPRPRKLDLDVRVGPDGSVTGISGSSRPEGV